MQVKTRKERSVKARIAQLQALNYMLSTGDYSIVTLNNMTNSDFYEFEKEYEFIDNHYKQYGKVPDLPSFISTFKTFEVIQVDEPKEYLVSAMVNSAWDDSLLKGMKTINQNLVDGNSEAAKNELRKLSDGLKKQNQHLEAVDLTEDTGRYDVYVDKGINFNKYYITTGFSKIDEILGGWSTEDYVTIAARPGVGKTYFALALIKGAVEAGKRVGLYSGEMSSDVIGYRFDSLVSHLSNRKLMRGDISVANDYKDYLDNTDWNGGHLFVLTRDGIPNNEATVNSFEGFIDKYDLDILFIDQHSLVDDQRHGKTDRESAANISKDIKNLQVLKKVPIVTLSQQNRTALEEGKQAGTENIAVSDRISQDSSVILFLTNNENVFTVSFGKTRFGGVNSKLNYAVDFDKGTFVYLPDEDSTAEEVQSVQDKYALYDDGEEICN